VGGTVRPSALKVLRFMISSTFVVCTTGRLAGVAPFGIFHRQRVGRVPCLVAANDSYGLLFAVTHRNRYGLRGAARHIWSDNWFRRADNRRISMYRIPGNIICVCVMEIA
jgi:hypothetical protein